MIITIDGYDGTGKTTLAKRLSERLGFVYMDKPFILKYQTEHGCTYEEAMKRTSEIEKGLFASKDKRLIATYYLEALRWLSNSHHDNIILDRGLLTTYAVVGYDETKDIFIDYINSGAFFDGSIYLVADDMERRKRIYLNDPNDPDLRYPVKWRENDLEEFASGMQLKYFRIVTDDKTSDDVFEEALNAISNNYTDEYVRKRIMGIPSEKE